MHWRYICMKRITAILLFLFSINIGIAQEKASVVDFKSFNQRIQSDTQGIVLYNFWATWCKPCVEELPFFQAIPSQIEGVSIKVVLVSLDFPSQFESRLLPFIAKKNIQQEVILLDGGNPNVWIDQIDSDWSGSIPATLFRYGNKRKFAEQSYESVDAILEDILSLIQP